MEASGTAAALPAALALLALLAVPTAAALDPAAAGIIVVEPGAIVHSSDGTLRFRILVPGDPVEVVVVLCGKRLEPRLLEDLGAFKLYGLDVHAGKTDLYTWRAYAAYSDGTVLDTGYRTTLLVTGGPRCPPPPGRTWTPPAPA